MNEDKTIAIEPEKAQQSDAYLSASTADTDEAGADFIQRRCQRVFEGAAHE